jgi:hypothetical protein
MLFLVDFREYGRRVVAPSVFSHAHSSNWAKSALASSIRIFADVSLLCGCTGIDATGYSPEALRWGDPRNSARFVGVQRVNAPSVFSEIWLVFHSSP